MEEMVNLIWDRLNLSNWPKHPRGMEWECGRVAKLREDACG